MTRLALVLGLLVACASSTHRGELALLSAHAVPSGYVIVDPRVQGESCGVSGALLEAAVRDALSRVPGADLLAEVSIVHRGGCYRVEGAALRLRNPSPSP